MKKRTLFICCLILCLAFTLVACGSASSENAQETTAGGSQETTAADTQETTAAAAEKSAISGWPSDNEIAKKIPVCSTGKIANVTEEPASIFIMISDVNRDESLAYWDKAQDTGYSEIISQNDTESTGGFTYVAKNSDNISLSVTWAPGSGKGTLTVLGIQL